MAEDKKRFYWLKLQRDFFKRHDIRIIESMPNGKDYILFYLKLLCESIDHDGNLRFNDQIPYNLEMLSVITNTNVDIVRSAVDIFTNLGMMGIMDDGTYFMNAVTNMIGSNVDNASANRQRLFRENQKLKALSVADHYAATYGNDPVTEEVTSGVTKSNAPVTESVTPSVTKCNATVTAGVTESNESKRKSKSESESIENKKNNKYTTTNEDAQASARDTDTSDFLEKRLNVGDCDLAYNTAWKNSARARDATAQNIIDKAQAECLPACNLPNLHKLLTEAMENGVTPEELLEAARKLDDLDFGVWQFKMVDRRRHIRQDRLNSDNHAQEIRRRAAELLSGQDKSRDEMLRTAYG